MKPWTKEEAISTLKALADQADRLKNSRAFSTEHTMWGVKCEEAFEELFGPSSRYYQLFIQLRWRRTGSYVISTWEYGGNVEAARDAMNQEAYLAQLDTAKGLLLASIDYLSERDIGDVYSAKDTGPEASMILKVLNLVEHKLRKTVRSKPEKETEVQDAFENLLIGADIPYSRESDSIEYSSKTYTPDFSLPRLDLAVEVKLCSRSEREKELPEEINDDILAYKTKYGNVVFIVYDLGHIRDKERFSASFEEYEGVTVRVVKH